MPPRLIDLDDDVLRVLHADTAEHCLLRCVCARYRALLPPPKNVCTNLEGVTRTAGRTLWAVREARCPPSAVMNYAARMARLHILKCLFEHTPCTPPTVETMRAAFRSGDTSVMDWVYERVAEMPRDLEELFVRHVHTSGLRWYVTHHLYEADENERVRFVKNCVLHCVACDNAPVFFWLFVNGYVNDRLVAGMNGQERTRLAQWLDASVL